MRILTLFLCALGVAGCTKEPTMFEKCHNTEISRASQLSGQAIETFAHQNGYPYYSSEVEKAFNDFITAYKNEFPDYLEKQVALYETQPEYAADLKRIGELQNQEPYITFKQFRKDFLRNRISLTDYKQSQYFECETHTVCKAIGDEILFIAEKWSSLREELNSKLPVTTYSAKEKVLWDKIEEALKVEPLSTWKMIFENANMTHEYNVITADLSGNLDKPLESYNTFHFIVSLTYEPDLEPVMEGFPWTESRKNLRKSIDSGHYEKYMRAKLAPLITKPTPEDVAELVCNQRGLYR